MGYKNYPRLIQSRDRITLNLQLLTNYGKTLIDELSRRDKINFLCLEEIVKKYSSWNFNIINELKCSFDSTFFSDFFEKESTLSIYLTDAQQQADKFKGTILKVLEEIENIKNKLFFC